MTHPLTRPQLHLCYLFSDLKWKAKLGYVIIKSTNQVIRKNIKSNYLLFYHLSLKNLLSMNKICIWIVKLYDFPFQMTICLIQHVNIIYILLHIFIFKTFNNVVDRTFWLIQRRLTMAFNTLSVHLIILKMVIWIIRLPRIVPDGFQIWEGSYIWRTKKKYLFL